MIRTFTTSAEQDAAIAWRVAQLEASGTPATEDALIAQFAQLALSDLVKTYRDTEGARVYAAFQSATADERAAAKAALKLDG